MGVVAPPEEPPAPPASPDLLARLTGAVDRAREAAVEEAAVDMGAAAGAEAVGEHVEARREDGAVTHYFEARHGGYRGWRWAVTLACADAESPLTVSEVVLQPGPQALVSPEWVPWHERVRPGDLGVGDLLPAGPDDSRLVPAYLADGDAEIEDLAREVGLGRRAVLSREGRDDAVRRWTQGPFGPGAEMARAAPARCATCGFLLPLAGALRGAFGVCANAYSPADGAVVASGFGCGAHSDVSVEPVSPVAVVDLVYDDGVELEPVGTGA